MTTLLLLLQSYRTRLHSRENAGTRSRMNKNSPPLSRFLFSKDTLSNPIESSLQSLLLRRRSHRQMRSQRNHRMQSLNLWFPHLLAGFAPLWSLHPLHAWQHTTASCLLVVLRSWTPFGAQCVRYTTALWSKDSVRKRRNKGAGDIERFAILIGLVLRPPGALAY